MAIAAFSLFTFPGEFHFRLRDFKKSRKVLLKDGLYAGEFKRLIKLGKPLLTILIFSFAFGFWEYAIWTFEPIWTNYVGAGLLLGAFILMLDSIPYVPFDIAAGLITNKIGLKKMLMIGAVFTILGQSFFLFQHSLFALTLTFIVTPLGISFLAIPMDVYIKRNVKGNLYGQVYGIDYMVYEIGGVMGPLAVGAMATLADITSIIYLTFALFLVSITALIFMFETDI